MNELDASTLFGRAMGAYAHNFVPFTAVVLIVMSPVFLLQILSILGIFGAPDPESLNTGDWIAMILSFFLSPVVVGALTWGVIESERGRRVELASCVQQGLTRVGSILGVSILTGLAVFGGALLLVVPGVIAACALYVAVPTTVVEGTAIRESMQRSLALTEGKRLSVLGVLFLVGLVHGVPIGLSAYIFGAGSLLHAAINLVFGVIGTALAAIAATVAYNALRSAREGVEIDDIAAVFD